MTDIMLGSEEGTCTHWFDVNNNTLSVSEEEMLHLQSITSHIRVFYLLGHEEKSFSVDITPPQSYQNIIEKIYFAVEKMKKIMNKLNCLMTKEISPTNTPDTSDVSTIDWHDLVHQEAEYRQSEEMMKKYAEIESDESLQDWISYTAEVVQPYILQKNGIEPNAFNLHKLRVAAGETDVFWVKHNRAREGMLSPGDTIPTNVYLYDVDNQCKVNVREVSMALSQPMVLLAGSIS